MVAFGIVRMNGRKSISKNSAGNAKAHTTVTTTPVDVTNSSSPRASYVDSIDDITDDYLKSCYDDFVNRDALSDGGIDLIEFCCAKDMNNVKAGQNHNSLCFIVEANDQSSYSLYEYADIKKDSNGKLLPATYKGKTKSFDSEAEMWDYLNNTYQYYPYGAADVYEMGS